MRSCRPVETVAEDSRTADPRIRLVGVRARAACGGSLHERNLAEVNLLTSFLFSLRTRCDLISIVSKESCSVFHVQALYPADWTCFANPLAREGPRPQNGNTTSGTESLGRSEECYGQGSEITARISRMSSSIPDRRVTAL